MMGQARAENAQRVWGIDGPLYSEQCGEEGRVRRGHMVWNGPLELCRNADSHSVRLGLGLGPCISDPLPGEVSRETPRELYKLLVRRPSPSWVGRTVPVEGEGWGRAQTPVFPSPASPFENHCCRTFWVVKA